MGKKKKSVADELITRHKASAKPEDRDPLHELDRYKDIARAMYALNASEKRRAVAWFISKYDVSDA